jgi:hypothetical protein
MATAKKKEVEVNQPKEVEFFDGVKKFQSNGVSKHMDKDSVFELNFEMATLLVGSGYGQIID